MKFYESIAPYYDHIFPLNYDQIGFILDATENEESSNILDVGCGTGNLTIALSKVCKSVIGIDLDKEMLKLAADKSFSDNIEFKECNMLSLTDQFSTDEFDTIVCFGNTLVHLDGIKEIEDFVAQCYTLLKPAGKLLIQIINYDRVLDEGINSLPTIENDHVKFVRNYDYNPDHHEICFSTELLHKKSCTVIDSEQFLYPVRKQELEEVFIAKGFKVNNKYGGFNKQENLLSSIPFIIEAEKV